MSLLAPGRNIVLVGMMGAGKSTVGRLVAQRLGRSFVDTDELVAAEAKASVGDIFAAQGERGFRRLEAEAVRAVAALRGQVIAVGGGAVLDPNNVTHLRATGDIVWLDAQPSALAQRTAGGVERPLLTGDMPAEQRLVQLREERFRTYADSASHVVDTTGLAADEVADAVVAWAQRQPGLLSRDEPA